MALTMKYYPVMVYVHIIIYADNKIVDHYIRYQTQVKDHNPNIDLYEYLFYINKSLAVGKRGISTQPRQSNLRGPHVQASKQDTTLKWDCPENMHHKNAFS